MPFCTASAFARAPPARPARAARRSSRAAAGRPAPGPGRRPAGAGRATRRRARSRARARRVASCRRRRRRPLRQHALDGRVAARDPQLPHHVRRRQRRREHLDVAARRRPRPARDRWRVNSSACGAPVCWRRRLSAWPCCDSGTSDMPNAMIARLVVEVGQHRVERRAADREARLERAVDAHVEPRLDALAEELHRDEVDQRAGHQPHQAERHREAHHHPRAELAGAIAAREADDEHDDDEQQRRRRRRVERQQQRIVTLEQRRVRRRRREQEQQHAGDRRRERDAVAQRARAPERARTATAGGGFRRWGSRAVIDVLCRSARSRVDAAGRRDRRDV